MRVGSKLVALESTRRSFPRCRNRSGAGKRWVVAALYVDALGELYLIEFGHGSAAVTLPAVLDLQAQRSVRSDVMRPRSGPVNGKGSDRETWGTTNNAAVNSGTDPQIPGVARCGLDSTTDSNIAGSCQRRA